MLRWKDNRYVLQVYRDRVALSRQGATPADIVKECPFDDSGVAKAVLSCVEQISQTSAELEVVLDDSYARFWQVTPPSGTTRFADLQAAASLRFETLFGLPRNEWLIEAAWNAKKEFWACAIPAPLIHAIEEALRGSQKKVKISGSYPYFIQQWNQHASLLGKKTEGFAVVNEGAMTLALISNASIKSIRTLAVDHRDPQTMQIADRTIHSLSLQLGIEPPQEVLLAGRLDGYRKEYMSGKILWRQIPLNLSSSASPLSTLGEAA